MRFPPESPSSAQFQEAVAQSLQELHHAPGELRDDMQRHFGQFSDEARAIFLTFFEHAGIRIPLCCPTADDSDLPWVDVDVRPATRDAHTLSCLLPFGMLAAVVTILQAVHGNHILPVMTGTIVMATVAVLSQSSAEPIRDEIGHWHLGKLSIAWTGWITAGCLCLQQGSFYFWTTHTSRDRIMSKAQIRQAVTDYTIKTTELGAGLNLALLLC